MGNHPACVYFQVPIFYFPSVILFWLQYLSSFTFPGYEKYNTIRADPTLCFLDRVGRPDEKAIAAEQRGNDFMDGWVHAASLEPENILFLLLCLPGWLFEF